MSTFDFSIKPVEALRNDLDRLTILRGLLDTPPLVQLVNLMNELLSDDAMPFDIQWAYHDFAAAVLSRVGEPITEDRWRDFLVEMILERENAFSLAASRGRADEVLVRAFARDLSIVQSLFLLDDAMIRNWCTPSQGGIDLSHWASFSNMGYYIVEGDGPLPTMRRMLLSSEDWSLLATPLMEMHAQFGAGAMLGHRILAFSAEGLFPIERVADRAAEPDARIAAHLSAFAAGGAPGALLVCGHDAQRIARDALLRCELTVVRLYDVTLYPLLRERLLGVKRRFAALLPAPHPGDPLLGDLLGEGLERPSDNLLPVLYSPVSDPMLTGRMTSIPIDSDK